MKIFIFLSLFVFTACSQRQVYESVQANNRNECELLSGVQRQECLKRLSPDYQTYERKRQELIKKE